jgi:hypothetical protein
MFKHIIKTSTLILLALPILLHLFIVNRWAVNVPFYDDFEWAIVFLDEYLKANSIWERISLIFSQHNQHRIIWLRLSVVWIHKILGYLDFKYLVYIGNLSFFGLTTVFLFAFQKTKTRLFYALPLVLILHQFKSVHNIIISYGVPNMSVIFFAILAFFLVQCKKSKYLYLGLLAGFIATFCNGSGIIVMPLISIFAFITIEKKRYIPVLIMTGITLIIFFSGYETDYKEITFSFASVDYLFEFMGSYLPKISSWYVKGLLFVIFAFLVYYGFSKVRKNALEDRRIRLLAFLFCTSLFLGGAGLMATLFRVIHNLEIPDWYYIYSTTFIATLYLAMLTLFDKEKQRLAAFLVFFSVSSLVYFKSLGQDLVKMKGIVSYLEADAANYKRNGSWAFLPERMGREMLNDWQSTYTKLYQSKDVKLDPSYIDQISIDTHHQSMSNQISIDTSHAHHFNIKYTPLEFNKEMLSSKKRFGFLERDDGKKQYIIGVYNWPNSTYQTIKNQSFFNGNSTFIVSKKAMSENIAEGKYYPGFVFVSNDGTVKQIWSTEQIEIENW